MIPAFGALMFSALGVATANTPVHPTVSTPGGILQLCAGLLIHKCEGTSSVESSSLLSSRCI